MSGCVCMVLNRGDAMDSVGVNTRNPFASDFQRRHAMPAVKMDSHSLRPRKTMCEACPFRTEGPYRSQLSGLVASALAEASRTCYSTGTNSRANAGTGTRRALCRGARDIILSYLHLIGFLEAPTDEALANPKADSCEGSVNSAYGSRAD